MSRLGLALLLGTMPACLWAAVRVEALRTDGESVQGELIEAWPELRLMTGEGPVTLAWNGLLELRPLPPASSSAPSSAPSDDAWWFATADGSRLVGRMTGTSERAAIVTLGDGQSLTVALDALEWMRAARQPPAADRGEDADATGDVAYVLRESGQTLAVRGAVRGVTPEHLVFERSGKSLSIAWSKLAEIRFAPPAPRGASVRVRMRDAQIFGGALAEADATGVWLRSSLAPILALRWESIERIELAGSDVVFLARMRPARYESEPLFAKRWPYAVDRGLDGGPIVVAGRTSANSIVMHSRSLLGYRCDGRFRQFAARVAIVDAMDRRGNAKVQVVGDGRVLWEADPVRGGEAPRDVLVDIQGVQELLLVVDYGDDLDLSDQVAWIMPRMLR